MSNPNSSKLGTSACVTYSVFREGQDGQPLDLDNLRGITGEKLGSIELGGVSGEFPPRHRKMFLGVDYNKR